MNFKFYAMWIPVLSVIGSLIWSTPATAQMQIIIRQEGPASQSQPNSNSQSNPGASGQANQAVNAVTESQTDTTVPLPAAAIPGETEYDRHMRLGYAASGNGEYATALNYFEQALSVNPGDRLATLAYWNMVDALQRSPVQSVSTRGETPTEFDRIMNLGYAATDAREYETALRYFQQALQLRPDNPYASQAIRNVSTYIDRSQ